MRVDWMRVIGTTALIVAVGGFVSYIAYDEITKEPSACDRARERVDAWEIVLGVPDDFSDIEPAEALQVLARIERANPQGYKEWQQDLDYVGVCYVPDEPDYERPGP